MGGRVQIDGLTSSDWLALSDAELDALVFVGPVLFQAGTAEVLGEFRRSPAALTIVLAHIDGGGEGVLLGLWLLARQFARARGIPEIRWVVHAVTCAEPNRKLQRVLDKRGFQISTTEAHGTAYQLVDVL